MSRVTARVAGGPRLVAATLLCAAAIHPALAQSIVTAAAVWRPDAGFIARFHAECEGRRGDAFTACFAEAMKQAGAPAAALDFAHRLGNEGYLRALQPTAGPIAVAHVFYPFRANENDAWLLVNGRPPLIDVDRQDELPLAQMRSTPAYEEIRRRYPNVTFWPGERGNRGPEVRQSGRRFVLGYQLHDLCHACAIIGRVRCAFDFDADGKFLGARLVSVTAVAQ